MVLGGQLPPMDGQLGTEDANRGHTDSGAIWSRIPDLAPWRRRLLSLPIPRILIQRLQEFPAESVNVLVMKL